MPPAPEVPNMPHNPHPLKYLTRPSILNMHYYPTLEVSNLLHYTPLQKYETCPTCPPPSTYSNIRCYPLLKYLDMPDHQH